MRIAFYAPFKPLDHPNPSGDLMIGRSIFSHLEDQEHQVRVVSRLRARWIYWKPWQLVQTLFEQRRIIKKLSKEPVDLWLTYHCYYKAPDILGPSVCRKLNIPYVIFQGSYATKFRRRLKTLPGFFLNRRALLAAQQHITNRSRDLKNLRRIIPEENISFIKPGIHPAQFQFASLARQEMRKQWQAGDRPVILTAAMFRPDVKSEGIAWVIESCGRLAKQGHRFLLVIGGDGRERERLQKLAAKLPPASVLFVGRIPRNEMYRFYSGGDFFVFPGFKESLGMVFLEAQSCGLPVIACDNGGIPEVVQHRKTGLLTPIYDKQKFDEAVISLLANEQQRETMSRNAAKYVRKEHDVARNYRNLEAILQGLMHSAGFAGVKN